MMSIFNQPKPETITLCAANELDTNFICSKIGLERGTYVNIISNNEDVKHKLTNAIVVSLSSGLNLFNNNDFVVDYSNNKDPDSKGMKVLIVSKFANSSSLIVSMSRIASNYGINPSDVKNISLKRLDYFLEEYLMADDFSTREKGIQFLEDCFRPYDVVVFDNVSDYLIENEYDSKVAVCLNRLRDIAESTNTLIIGLENTGKSKDGIKYSIRGSSAKHDIVDQIIYANVVESTTFNNGSNCSKLLLTCSKIKSSTKWNSVSMVVQDKGEYLDKQKCFEFLSVEVSSEVVVANHKARTSKVITKRKLNFSKEIVKLLRANVNGKTMQEIRSETGFSSSSPVMRNYTNEVIELFVDNGLLLKTKHGKKTLYSLNSNNLDKLNKLQRVIRTGDTK